MVTVFFIYSVLLATVGGTVDTLGPDVLVNLEWDATLLANVVAWWTQFAEDIDLEMDSICPYSLTAS